ncbi:MAG: 23S rRNA (adenine(2503)-C(2))-methyltransferase RlmN [Candidatus Acididesulfobacter guangdongensis]|uniref:23S rRNA (Adenine(2503)-C(2))-methyltransferase RlmN n=1 Tax=Acididesulfobacter guangdongensis TaxID=2597225 RepID=A0A519BEG5_ACIG2|nr:MAG: 23S rRNA (adenine(2503)-C(2))-methyltransferase RlmN [Candidatus Acididesulfobacter guangdongensis]
MTNKNSIFCLSLEELEAFCIKNSAKKFNAFQIMKWIYSAKVYDFNNMTNISKTLRASLDYHFNFTMPEITANFREDAADGNYSIKYLIKLNDGSAIESVFIDYGKRKTLCVSSQAGCKMLCDFCSTGNSGFQRNLTSGEIISQILLIENECKTKITNIVFMGMGEPLDNLSEVKKALEIISDPNFIGVARRKITISTCGIIDKLIEIKDLKYKIAISLNASNNYSRSQIMPINKKYPIEDIAKFISSGKYFGHNKITLEYVLLKDFNDSINNAKELIKLFFPQNVKFNLIPFNKFDIENTDLAKTSCGTPTKNNYERTSETAYNNFQDKLMKAGFIVTIRHSKAQSIYGGCGQLKVNLL